MVAFTAMGAAPADVRHLLSEGGLMNSCFETGRRCKRRG